MNGGRSINGNRARSHLRALVALLAIQELAYVGETAHTMLNMWAQCSAIRLGPTGHVQLRKGKAWTNAALTDFAFSYSPEVVTQAARLFGLAIHY